MPNTEIPGEYFTSSDVIDLDFNHYILKYDYPVSGDEMAQIVRDLKG